MSNYSFNMTEVFFDSYKVHYQGISHKIIDTRIESINNIDHYLLTTEEDHKFCFANGDLHHEKDFPSVIWNDDSKMWYKKGKIHRSKELPAIVWSFGKEEYYIKGIQLKESEIPKLVTQKKIEDF